MKSKKTKNLDVALTHEEMLAKWFKDPNFKAEYEALEEEYRLVSEMLHARKRAGLTQADVAELMGTKAPAVARLEASNVAGKSSPSVYTLRKYAHAVGCRLEIHLCPFKKKSASK